MILQLPDVALPVRLGITVGDDPGHRLRTFGQAAELLWPGVQRGGELLKSTSQFLTLDFTNYHKVVSISDAKLDK